MQEGFRPTHTHTQSTPNYVRVFTSTKFQVVDWLFSRIAYVLARIKQLKKITVTRFPYRNIDSSQTAQVPAIQIQKFLLNMKPFVCRNDWACRLWRQCFRLVFCNPLFDSWSKHRLPRVFPLPLSSPPPTSLDNYRNSTSSLKYTTTTSPPSPTHHTIRPKTTYTIHKVSPAISNPLHRYSKFEKINFCLRHTELIWRQLQLSLRAALQDIKLNFV